MLRVPHTTQSPGIAQQHSAAAGNTMSRQSPTPRPTETKSTEAGPWCCPRQEDRFQSEPRHALTGQETPPLLAPVASSIEWESMVQPVQPSSWHVGRNLRVPRACPGSCGCTRTRRWVGRDERTAVPRGFLLDSHLMG